MASSSLTTWAQHRSSMGANASDTARSLSKKANAMSKKRDVDHAAAATAHTHAASALRTASAGEPSPAARKIMLQIASDHDVSAINHNAAQSRGFHGHFD